MKEQEQPMILENNIDIETNVPKSTNDAMQNNVSASTNNDDDEQSEKSHTDKVALNEDIYKCKYCYKLYTTPFNKNRHEATHKVDEAISSTVKVENDDDLYSNGEKSMKEQKQPMKPVNDVVKQIIETIPPKSTNIAMQTNVSDSASNAKQSTDSNQSTCRWWLYNLYENQLFPLIPYYVPSTKK
jgi:hypothetical protein